MSRMRSSKILLCVLAVATIFLVASLSVPIFAQTGIERCCFGAPTAKSLKDTVTPKSFTVNSGGSEVIKVKIDNANKSSFAVSEFYVWTNVKGVGNFSEAVSFTLPAGKSYTFTYTYDCGNLPAGSYTGSAQFYGSLSGYKDGYLSYPGTFTFKVK